VNRDKAAVGDRVLQIFDEIVKVDHQQRAVTAQAIQNRLAKRAARTIFHEKLVLSQSTADRTRLMVNREEGTIEPTITGFFRKPSKKTPHGPKARFSLLFTLASGAVRPFRLSCSCQIPTLTSASDGWFAKVQALASRLAQDLPQTASGRTVIHRHGAFTDAVQRI
jgi:hypothetical protein